MLADGNALVRADLAEPEFGSSGRLMAERHADYLFRGSSDDSYIPEPQLLAGETWTEWQGLGVLQGRIFIGAGARGILHLPVSGDDAGLIDVGGECLDLVVAQERIIALVRTNEDDAGRTLLVLGWQAQTGTTEILAQHAIAEPLDRLVR